AYAIQRIKVLEVEISERDSLNAEAYVDHVQSHIRTRLESVDSGNTWSATRWVEMRFFSLRAQPNENGNVVILSFLNEYWTYRDIHRMIREFPVGTPMDEVDDTVQSLIGAVFQAMYDRLKEDEKALNRKREEVMSAFGS